jgi:hypothetical protein
MTRVFEATRDTAWCADAVCGGGGWALLATLSVTGSGSCKLHVLDCWRVFDLLWLLLQRVCTCAARVQPEGTLDL